MGANRQTNQHNKMKAKIKEELCRKMKIEIKDINEIKEGINSTVYEAKTRDEQTIIVKIAGECEKRPSSIRFKAETEFYEYTENMNLNMPRMLCKEKQTNG